MNNDDRMNESHYNSFETPLGESMENIEERIDKEFIELIRGHYSNLNKKEMCVCIGFCYAIWDRNYNTTYDTIVYYSFLVGKKRYMQVEGEALFADEQEAKKIIEQLKEKGIMRSSVGYTVNGFRGKCRSRICPKVFYHIVRYLDMKPEIEDEAFLTISRQFEAAMQSAFGPIQPE